MKNTARTINDRTVSCSEELTRKPTAKSQEDSVREAKEIRENLTEQDIDRTLQDSFPASDLPPWY